MRIMRLGDAAQRIGRSVRTLFRWQEQGLLRIYPGGWVVESEVVRAEAAVRRRLLVRKYVPPET